MLGQTAVIGQPLIIQPAGYGFFGFAQSGLLQGLQGCQTAPQIMLLLADIVLLPVKFILLLAALANGFQHLGHLLFQLGLAHLGGFRLLLQLLQLDFHIIASELALFVFQFFQTLLLLGNMPLQMLHAGALDLRLLGRLGHPLIIILPVFLPFLHGLFRFLQGFIGGHLGFPLHFQLWLVLFQNQADFFQFLTVFFQGFLQLLQAGFQLLQIRILALIGFFLMLDGLLKAGDFRA